MNDGGQVGFRLDFSNIAHTVETGGTDVPTPFDGLLDQGADLFKNPAFKREVKKFSNLAFVGGGIGAVIGSSLPFLGPALGTQLGAGIALAVGGLVNFVNDSWKGLTGQRCTFMLRHEGDIRCDQYPDRITAAANWIRENTAEAAKMSVAHLADKFRIAETNQQIRNATGQDEEARPLKELPGAYELLVGVQLPLAMAYMLALPPETRMSNALQLPTLFPTIGPPELTALMNRLQSPDPARVRAPSGDGQKTGIPAPLLLAAAGLGGLWFYSRKTRQSLGGAARGLFQKTKRLFR